ncbi:MAG: hypothetical protein HXX14_14925 [Bacteroidetes bacterium]|nr:hypothetical protein [Bacteroidota bacterium]
MKKYFLSLLGICFYLFTIGQTMVSFQSSDSALENAFNWAKKTALKYKGDSLDPVGPWYEAALPSRYAFCIRDVSHQCIGAEILGMNRENKNMLSKFLANISKSRNWCSFWEINKWNKPALADYKNDREFWYNLNANFELIYACRRLYEWTGDKTYITDPLFINFCERSLNEYVKDWVLDVDSLLTRPSLPNTPLSFDKNDMFLKSRGLPSYVENVPDLKMSADLIAAIYEGFVSYSYILRENDNITQSNYYAQKAGQYQKHLESKWWNIANQHYNTLYKNNGAFDNGDGSVFLLWFNIINDPSRKNTIIHDLISADLNVETMSYLPYLLYLNGSGEQAYRYILHLSDPATKRREYPEVSFGVIEGIIQGLMGIEPDVHSNTISTLFRGKDEVELKVDNLFVLNSFISVQHYSTHKTLVTNKGDKSINWKAGFAGKYSTIYVDGKPVNASLVNNIDGSIFSVVNVMVQSGQQLEASVK